MGDCFLQDNFPLGVSSPARTLFGSEGALRGWKDFDDYIFLEFQARFAAFINWLHRGGVSHSRTNCNKSDFWVEPSLIWGARDIAVRCSRLERYCWQLLSPQAILLAAPLASSNIAGSSSRLERSCWQLLSPPAILFAAANFLVPLRLMRPRCWSGSPVACAGRTFHAAALAFCDMACSCSRLLRYCWQLLSLRVILLAAALVSSDIAGSCSHLQRYFCWQLLSPRAILLAAALASSDIAGSCSRLERSCC